MPKKAIARKICSLQNKIVRELSNAHIFLRQAQPLLEGARATFESSKSKSDRRYYVPSTDKKKFSKRTDAELKEIYAHYTSSGLFEAFLVSSISQFESFLADVLIVLLQYHPQRINESIQGIPDCPGVSAKDLMAAENKEELVQRVLSDHVTNVFRQRASLYTTYLAGLVSVKMDPSFADYFEVAASSGIVKHCACASPCCRHWALGNSTRDTKTFSCTVNGYRS